MVGHLVFRSVTWLVGQQTQLITAVILSVVTSAHQPNTQHIKHYSQLHADDTGEVSEQCFTSPPTQYRLYGRRFLQVKRPNQQYQSTEGSYKGKQHKKHKENRKYTHTHTQNSIQITVTQTNTASPLVYNNIWGD